MSTEPRRLAWVDVARGIGIALVVIGHVVIGLVDAGLAEATGPLGQVYAVVYTFHMPLFFWLSGLFTQQTVARGPAAVWRGLGTRIVWPYVLWSTVQLLVMSAAGGHLNHEVQASAGRWLALAWQPLSQFWFLHTLALFQIMAWLLLPRIGPRGLLWLGLGLLMLPPLVDLPPVLANPCRFALFFALGTMGLQPGGRPFDALAATPRALGSVLALAGCAIVALAVQARGLIPWSPQALPAAVLGVVGCLGLATLARGPLARGLGALGRSSMAVYLLHILFASGTRIVLNRWAHVESLWALLPLSALAGVAGPLLAERAATRAGVQRLLGLRA